MKREKIRTTSKQINKVLRRAIPGHLFTAQHDLVPEAALIFAVLSQAVEDSMSRGRQCYRDEGEDYEYSAEEARAWFSSPAAARLCEHIGLNPTYVLELMRDHAWVGNAS